MSSETRDRTPILPSLVEGEGADTSDARDGFLAAHPECAAWTVVALPYAIRTKKGVLRIYTWSRRWAEAHCRGTWHGTPQAFAFADADEGLRFRTALKSVDVGGGDGSGV